MRKIPTLFQRETDPARRHLVVDVVTPGCEWVLAGEGAATRKYDGTCVLVDECGQVFTRREVKQGKQPPPNYTEVEFDTNTGKSFGWEPVDQSGFAKFVDEAIERARFGWMPGTYELIGPKIQGNPEGLMWHHLVAHVHADPLPEFDHPSGFADLAVRVPLLPFEGIVWHHRLDGRMAKLKRRDFPRVTP